MVDASLNDPICSLNDSLTLENIMQVFENAVEVNGLFESEVKTVLGRIGGIAVASIVFDGGEDGVELTEGKLAKIKDFAGFALAYDLPFVVFDNVKGIKATMCANNSRVLKLTAEYLEIFDAINTAKIAVVYKKAIGLGYSLFASKSVGFDYTCAFVNAKIALFDSVQGAQIELGDEKADKESLAKRYADENADPIHAAKNGYLDAVIEPQFVKQYIIASLQMLAR